MKDSEIVEYRGLQYTVQATGSYYTSWPRKRDGISMLHRMVWFDCYGAIPKGHHIHHKDGNWRNNKIENLECMSSGEHYKLHAIRRSRNPEFMEAARERMAVAAQKACEWHSSPIGLEWHAGHAKKIWETALTKPKQCETCYVEYQTYRSDSQYCSSACAQKIGYRRYFTDERKCEWCDKKFMSNRHRDTKFCSYNCSNKAGGEERKITLPKKFCIFCSKEFQPTIKHPDIEHCSRGCSIRKRFADKKSLAGRN